MLRHSLVDDVELVLLVLLVVEVEARVVNISIVKICFIISTVLVDVVLVLVVDVVLVLVVAVVVVAASE